MKKFLVFCGLVLLTVFVVACGNSEKDLVEVEDEEITEEEVEPIHVTDPVVIEPEVTETSYTYFAPLTGIGLEEPLKDRIAMVIIENQKQARPQTGLDKADMVYEFLVEGGITRFAAFYQSEYPELVGPVRSIRPYFLRLSEGFNALIVHAGWSPEAQSIILNEKLPSINGLTYEPKYFWRDKTRKAPHNMYTNFDEIKAAAQMLKYKTEVDTPVFMYKEVTEEAEGDPATDITIKYNSSYRVGYQYDADDQIYIRSMNGEEHADAQTKEPLTATNILVILTKHKVLDNVGRLSIDITSGGKGYLFQRGKVQEITWKNVDGIIQPYLDGKQLALYPGKTWINVVTDTAPGVSYK